ncbi:50S ribosomal protein L11 methyltransferase [Streptomyces sp. HSW2009]|uniref:methyltransferase domain-containing protein n=1 Tax=Streptomyces sp. HSW2009 TaxID=3142890 RepID=UPI0032ECE10C
MSDVRDYRRSLARSREALRSGERPKTFLLDGREWDLLPEVFAPDISPSSGHSLALLGLSPHLTPRSGSLLEIGSGTGVVAVLSAVAGCERVVAADINPQAVRNTASNAARHGVTDRVRAVRSDLFDGLDPGERFDVIFWHSNYVLAPADYAYRDMHERSYVDPGYAAHRRYLAEAGTWLAPGGRVLLHFSSRGDRAALEQVADESGCRLIAARTLSAREGEHQIEHTLLEVVARRD